MSRAEARRTIARRQLRRNMRRSDGLGLARIHAEAEMKVSKRYNAEGTVTVIAETEVPLSAAVVSARGVA